MLQRIQTTGVIFSWGCICCLTKSCCTARNLGNCMLDNNYFNEACKYSRARSGIKLTNNKSLMPQNLIIFTQ